jgi:hypothetical protein
LEWGRQGVRCAIDEHCPDAGRDPRPRTDLPARHVPLAAGCVKTPPAAERVDGFSIGDPPSPSWSAPGSG